MLHLTVILTEYFTFTLDQGITSILSPSEHTKYLALKDQWLNIYEIGELHIYYTTYSHTALTVK